MTANPLAFTLKTPTLKAAMRDMTITVTVSRPVRFRVWLATKLVDLAAWLVGARTEQVQA